MKASQNAQLYPYFENVHTLGLSPVLTNMRSACERWACEKRICELIPITILVSWLLNPLYSKGQRDLQYLSMVKLLEKPMNWFWVSIILVANLSNFKTPLLTIFVVAPNHKIDGCWQGGWTCNIVLVTHLQKDQ